MADRFDVIVIGGGQSGLAMGYYLRRSGFSYIILDNQKEGGGAWLHTWKSLAALSILYLQGENTRMCFHERTLEATELPASNSMKGWFLADK